MFAAIARNPLFSSYAVTTPLPANLPTVAPAKITAEEVESAAKELGLTKVTVESIQAQRILGAHLSEIGVASVARGVLLLNMDKMTRMMDKVEGIIEDLPHEPGVQAKLIASYATIGRAVTETAKNLMETGDPKPESQAPRPPVGLPSSQVNIQVNGGTVKVRDEVLQKGAP